MRKFFKMIATAMLVFALIVPVANAELQDMKATVYSWDGKISTDGKPVLTKLTSGVRFWVCAINTSTLETLYEHTDLDGQAMTSLTNPITSTNFASDTVCGDKIRFKVDPTDSADDRYVDLYVVDTNGGYFAFVENFDKYHHTVVIDERPGVVHHGVYRSAVITSTTEVDTEIDFDYDTFIHNVFVEIVTVETAQSGGVGVGVDVGLDTSSSGDVNGFVDGSDLTSSGYPTQSATVKGALIDDGTSDSLAYAIDGTDEVELCYAGDSTGNALGVVNIHYMFSVIPKH